MSVSIQTQLAAVIREISMRQRVYPKWVAAQKMSQEKADAELSAMRAVAETLSSLIGGAT